MKGQIRNLAAIGAITALFMVGIVSMSPRASAVTGITCLDNSQAGADVTDIAPAQLNDQINCTAVTSHTGIVASTIVAIPPSGPAFTLNTGSGALTNTINSGNFNVNQNGVWTVEADFFDANGVKTQTELINISISFLVIPESTLGVAALVGSSLAALGGFVFFRKNGNKAAPVMI